MNTKIVYITGCLGLIGSYVTRKLLERGYYVKGIDKCTYAANTNLIKEFKSYPNFSFEDKDINDLEFLYDCDYVINIAAETHVGNSIVESKEFIWSNINGVQNLLELLRNYRQENNRTPRLIHFSTDEVYGDIVSGAHKETDILKPSNPYSATKAGSDMLIKAWSRTYGLEYTILRPTNNYGIGQYVEKLIPKSCKYIGIGRKVPLHNGGQPIRNWLHAEDTATAVTTVIDHHERTKNEIYNICGGFEQSNIDTVSAVVFLMTGSLDPTDYIDTSIVRPGQDVRYALDDSKIRELGWKPKKVFGEELPKIVDYYKDRFIW